MLHATRKCPGLIKSVGFWEGWLGRCVSTASKCESPVMTQVGASDKIASSATWWGTMTAFPLSRCLAITPHSSRDCAVFRFIILVYDFDYPASAMNGKSRRHTLSPHKNKLHEPNVDDSKLGFPSPLWLYVMWRKVSCQNKNNKRRRRAMAYFK